MRPVTCALLLLLHVVGAVAAAENHGALTPLAGTTLQSTAAAETDGLFADFTTSLGAFTCRLDPAGAPMTVANFIGLATGERAWIDPENGEVRNEPYFDGLTFHRVIAKFMNQSGSRNGLGTDSPGYAFRDETATSGTHAAAGTLSSANSGPNSNGSQFFVTVTNTPWLDGKHTVFGQVTAGLDVVLAINQVETIAADNRPVVPVVLESVRIRRIGADAEAFDIGAQGLPLAASASAGIEKDAGTLRLTFPPAARTDTRIYRTTDLVQWTNASGGIQLEDPGTGTFTLATTNPAAFYRIAQVTYAESTRAPASPAGRTLTMDFGPVLGVIAVVFDQENGGTYTYREDVGTITRYDWQQEPYRVRLWPILYSNLVPMTLRLDFATPTSGTIEGTAFPTSTFFAVSGTFTLPE